MSKTDRMENALIGIGFPYSALGNEAVSYTHLAVYKRQDTLHPVTYRDVQGEWNSDFSFPGAKDVQRFLNENSVVRKNPKNARR